MKMHGKTISNKSNTKSRLLNSTLRNKSSLTSSRAGTKRGSMSTADRKTTDNRNPRGPINLNLNTSIGRLIRMKRLHQILTRRTLNSNGANRSSRRSSRHSKSKSNNITRRSRTLKRIRLLNKLTALRRLTRLTNSNMTSTARIAGNSAIDTNSLLRNQLTMNQKRGRSRNRRTTTNSPRLNTKRAASTRRSNRRTHRMRHIIADRRSMIRTQRTDGRSIRSRTRTRSRNKILTRINRDRKRSNLIIKGSTLRIRNMIRSLAGNRRKTKLRRHDTDKRRRRTRSNLSNARSSFLSKLALRNGTRRDRGTG